MKFHIKITVFSFLIIMLSLGFGGFLIVRATYVSELDIHVTSAIENNTFLSTIYYSIATNNLGTYTKDSDYLLKEFQAISNNGQVFIGTRDDIKFFDNNAFANKLKTNEQGNQLIMVHNIPYLQVITKMNIEGRDIYLENLVDLSKIYNLRNENYHSYCLFLIFMSIFAAFMIALFSIHITKPLNKLKETSKNIASGTFGERIPTTNKVMQSPEFISLARDFNNMADKIENYIKELKDYNHRQEDFIAKLTHELKTPLTSIIGYSDILRTGDMEPSKRYELANYIYKEGKRLEGLSQHLLQLILLKKETFPLKQYASKTFFRELRQSLRPLIHQYQIHLVLKITDATILIEPILLKSLLYNLIDNSCKASQKGDEIIVTGILMKGCYQITVQDFGKGIPKESIDKVTTPFYMVDKARTRKQGGAGIGLALCNEIAKIHHSNLIIDSVYQKGTKISFTVEVMKNED